MANVLGLGLIGPTIIAFGTRRAEKALSSKNSQRGRNLVPGILGTERRLRSGRSVDRSASSTAIIRRQRPKVWNSYGWAADWCELVVRTDPDCAETQRLTVLLVDMKSPGVEVRALRQMTGETRIQRIILPRRARPGRKCSGQSERRLERSHGHAHA